MKKVFIGLAVIIVLVIGGMFLLYSNLDKIVKAGIETAGTQVLGTPVAVDRVELDLVGGSASIYGFSIANPAGYSSGDMMRFDELSVALNMLDTNGQRVHVNSIVTRSPFVLYESIDGVSNLDTISARFSTEEEQAEPSNVVLVIDSIVIEDIQGTLQSDKLPSAVDVDLGDVRLSNLEGKPDELAGQIMAPVLSQVGAAAATALVQATRELLSNSSEQLQDAADSVADKANETLNKVGNLLKRN